MFLELREKKKTESHRGGVSWICFLLSFWSQSQELWTFPSPWWDTFRVGRSRCEGQGCVAVFCQGSIIFDLNCDLMSEKKDEYSQAKSKLTDWPFRGHETKQVSISHGYINTAFVPSRIINLGKTRLFQLMEREVKHLVEEWPGWWVAFEITSSKLYVGTSESGKNWQSSERKCCCHYGA